MVADFGLVSGLPVVVTSKAVDGSWARHNCSRDLAACQFAWISCRCRATAASLVLFLE